MNNNRYDRSVGVVYTANELAELAEFGKAYSRCYKPKKTTFFMPAIKEVIFNNPATIVIWDDESKTVVKVQEGDTFSKETGLAMCYAKRAMGNESNFNNVFKAWIKKE